MFRLGERVRVDPEHRTGKPDSAGGVGYVQGFQFDTPNQRTVTSYNVKYIIEKRTSPKVVPRRLHFAIIETTARKRKGDTIVKPSLLSRGRSLTRKYYAFLEQQKKDAEAAAARAAAEAKRHERYKKKHGQRNTVELLKDNMAHPRNSNVPSPAVQHLLDHRKKSPKGWLRQLESKSSTSISLSTHLDEQEKYLVYLLCATVDLNQDGVYPAIGHAWGKDPKTIKNIFHTPLARGGSFDFSRKKRSDAGTKKKILLKDRAANVDVFQP